MLKTIQRIFFVFVVMVSIISLQIDRALAVGNFTQSCTDIFMVTEGALEARCRTRNQRISLTGISINNLIANIDGQLEWNGEGNYRLSCGGCYLGQIDALQRTALNCNCRTRNGQEQYTSLDLDDRIANIDGQLSYVLP